MGKLSVFMMFAHILTIITICSAIDTKVWRKHKGEYKFLKVSIVWPKSFCNTKAEIDCAKPFINHFTIHGAWPMYSATRWVSAFNTTGCNTIEPLRPEDITRDLLGSIVPDIIRFWPDIEFYLDDAKNDSFWKYQWEKHGMCYKHPNDPRLYFHTALNIIKTYNFLQILNQGGYKPDNEFYNATEMAKTISDALGVDVDLRCNTNALENVQLHEIWVCLNRDDILESCKRPSRPSCPSDILIQFPSVIQVM